MPAAHHCCGLHLIPPLCIICARPSEEFYELTFERIHPQQVMARRGALATSPACALCQAASLGPALGCGLCWMFVLASRGLNCIRQGGKGHKPRQERAGSSEGPLQHGAAANGARAAPARAALPPGGRRRALRPHRLFPKKTSLFFVTRTPLIFIFPLQKSNFCYPRGETPQRWAGTHSLTGFLPHVQP